MCVWYLSETAESLADKRVDHGEQRYSQVLVSPVPNTISIGGPQVSFSQSKITLPAGGKAEVVVTFTAPRLAYPTIGLLPLYSGFVQINSTVAGSSSSNAYTSTWSPLKSAPTRAT